MNKPESNANHAVFLSEETYADQVIIAFDSMNKALIEFSETLRQSNQPIYIPSQSDNTEPDQQLLYCQQLFTNIWHTDGNDGRNTKSDYGLIGASSHLLNKAQQVNKTKTAFKDSVQKLKRSEINSLPELLYKYSRLHKRTRLLANVLEQDGLARLHLKQCYRQIPVLDTRPDTVRFSWYSSGRSIKRIDVKAAMEMLLKLDTSSPHIIQQIEKLSPLHSATPLAQIQEQVPVIRANFAWKQPDDSWQRSARNCPLPILVPLENGQALPEFNTLPDEPPEKRERALRSDSKIDPEPFLPSLRVHLYRN